MIELIANKKSNILKTNFQYKKLEKFFHNNEINFSLSKNAGNYLCNNIYYEGLNYIKQNKISAKMIFIHIPNIEESYDFDKLASVISKFIDSI